MSAAVVTREINRLDALSRTRALDERESRQLQTMIRTQARYGAMRVANARAQAKG